MNERILLAIDETPASERVVRYAAELLREAPTTFVLFTAIPPATASATPYRPVAEALVDGHTVLVVDEARRGSARRGVGERVRGESVPVA